MTNCLKCGTPYKEGYKFCKKCGTKFKELVGVKISPEVEAKVDILQKKIAAEPLNVELYIELGDIYNKNDLLAEALTQYQKSANIDDSNIDTHIKSGDVYFEMKELEKAKMSYHTALNLNPKSSYAQLGLFKIYYAKENLEKAIEQGKEFVRTDPKNVEVHKVLKEIYLQKGMKEKAFEEMQTISVLLPDDKKASMELGIQFLAKEQYEKASGCYERVLKVDSDDPDACFRMGELSCFKGDYDEAIQYLKHIVEKLSPEPMSIARMYLALAYINLEKSDKALKEIALVVQPKYEDLLNQHKKLFAEAYYKIGGTLLENNLSVAIDYLEKATKYEPQNLEYKDRLEETRDQQRVAKKKSRRKIAFATTGALSILVLAFAVWYLSHGRVLIQVTPERATVYVDGKPIAEKIERGRYLSPRLFFGAHKITVKKDGYEDWEQEVIAGYGKTAVVHATLVPIYIKLQIVTQPSGAKVLVDNEYKGKAPLTLNLIAKEHTISSRLWSQEITKNITLEKGEKKRLIITFWHLKKTGRLNYARSQYKRNPPTVLKDGNVLVTGGFSNGKYLSSCEIYDPIKEKWVTCGNLNTARYYHSATLIGDHKVLIAGGRIKGRWKHQTTDKSEILNYSTKKTSNTGRMIYRDYAWGSLAREGREGHSDILLDNGKVLIGGGASYGNGSRPVYSLEIFDPKQGSWEKTEYPGRGHYLILLKNGKIVAFCGGWGMDIDIFDPETPESHSRYSPQMDDKGIPPVLLNNGEILILGRGMYVGEGYGYRIFNPSTGSISSFLELDVNLFWKNPRIAALDSGKVVLIGQDFVKVYHPATDIWKDLPDIKIEKEEFEVAPLHSGDLLIIGGEKNDKAVTSCEILVAAKFSEEIIE